ncbi:hypothetical protein THAOC_26742 [Thalassiosira oceanica]|uniref:EamA domain-containing protein n=1 Tax=Thalassiosira oceanica TaxID=159749 RepID=K0RKP1_THAOC|nr:hypothetical protein THAOC_26742 [Thalassiosira oceanica]|eukprot:EJK53750.1 hypothetical protein THAOC_26742 [Thalassiosira oceanica]
MEKTTTVLLLKTIANHSAWSSLHVAARYLQVHAEPRHFDGMVVVSSTKGFAAIFRFGIGAVSGFWAHSKRAGFERLASVDGERSSIEDTAQIGHPTTRGRRRLRFMVLFAFVSTTRASTNIASAGYTYPFNITLISSLTPVIIALLDRFMLNSPYPPLLWPTIFISFIGGALIAMSQSAEVDSEISPRISDMDNLIGCSLQLLSALFSAFARILMKRSEGILTSNEIVQTNNISNCVFPLVYTLVYNPSSWGAFKYLLVRPKTLLAWCTISIGVYSFASVSQIKLVRSLGPGFYSWLEYAGISIMIVSVSVYLVRSQRWMEQREQNELQNEDGDERTNAQC